MFDEGVILYVGLLVLVIWRFLSGWRCCGKRMQFTNYCALLYMLLLVLIVYSIILFSSSALSSRGQSHWSTLPSWMRPFLIGAPFACVLVYGLAAVQTAQHVEKIFRNEAPQRHDRAVQIIALPAVYGTMCLSAMARCYQTVASGVLEIGDGTGNDTATAYNGPNATADAIAKVAEVADIQNMVEARSDICFFVGDLFEAWALYQFGQLTLDLIRSTIGRGTSDTDPHEREKAQALLRAHAAVESLAWLGVTLFLVVCILQAGWSIYLLTFTDTSDDWTSYNSQMNCFTAAGVVASFAAIWNVTIVERNFHIYLDSYAPLMKFITVKIIVTFAFFQQALVYVLEAIESTMPSAIQGLSRKLPIVGDILSFSDSQFTLFYSALLIYECVLIALLHLWAWSAEEAWYTEVTSEGEQEKEDEDPERRPLLS
mmetsp:Transcript_44018/g.114467  ORF Transcript_44018/g.114467 Transcript_44018/m.114467 type:complete len:428 (-) Transcript_44018:117-1400(-)